MPKITRLVLDVLKPHQPDAVEFSIALAGLDPGLRVTLTVQEVDEKTETVLLDIEGSDIQFAQLVQCIRDLGASLHSIDEVEVYGDAST